jgi:hypothetical protein
MAATSVDAAIRKLRTAANRIAATLVDFETDKDRALVDEAPLAGQTRARWDAALADLADLFRRYGQLVSLLDGVEAARRQGRLTAARRRELLAALSGPSIELGVHVVPLGERGLLGDGGVVERCTPDQLVGRLVATFAGVQDAVAAITAGWEVGGERLQAAREGVAAARALAAGAVPDALNDAERRLDGLGEAVFADPLGAAGRLDDELEAIAEACRAARAAAERCASFGPRLVAAQGLLGELVAAWSATESARAELVERIVVRTAPEPACRDPHIATALDRIEAAADAGDVDGASDDLDAWTASATERLHEALNRLSMMRRPMQRRAELRGRLEAYQAKARATGVQERPEVDDAYEVAEGALYSAPIDLDEAADAVDRYRRAVNAPRSGRVTC